MKSAFKSLFIVLAIVVFLLSMVWLYARLKALESPAPPASPHDFFSPRFADSQPAIIAHRGGWQDRPANTFIAFDRAASLSPHIILWADVGITKDSVLVVGRKILIHPDAPPAGLTKDPTLREFLLRYPEHRCILNLEDPTPGMARQLIALVDELDVSTRVLIQSDHDRVLRDLKKLKPTWLFGSSKAHITRLKMMSSIGLAALTPMDGNVYIIPWYQGDTPMLTKDVLDELKRRHMKVFIGPVNGPVQIQDFSKMNVDGIITPRPAELISEVQP